jgi:hypothetical protein
MLADHRLPAAASSFSFQINPDTQVKEQVTQIYCAIAIMAAVAVAAATAAAGVTASYLQVLLSRPATTF